MQKTDIVLLDSSPIYISLLPFLVLKQTYSSACMESTGAT